MSARSRSEALRSYRQELQRKLDCITRAVLNTREQKFNTSNDLIGLYLNNNHPVTLQSKLSLALSVGQQLQIIEKDATSGGSWEVEIKAYFYALEVPHGPEIVSYQWDPGGRSPIKHPHLHIGRGATGNVTTFGPRGLHRVHFPTKQITIDDVLRLAITEFDVEPRRRDWEHILSNT